MTTWDGSSNSAWHAAFNYGTSAYSTQDAELLAEVFSLAADGRRWLHAELPEPSAKPKTIEECWALIERIDKWVLSAFAESRRLEAFEKREPDVQNLLTDIACFTTEKTYTSSDEELAEIRAAAEALQAVKL